MAGATNLNFTEVGSGPLKLYGVELACTKANRRRSGGNRHQTAFSAVFDTETATVGGNDELAFVFVAGFNSHPTSGIASPWTQIGTSSEMQLWYQNDVANGTALDLSGSMSATADWISGIITLKTGLTVTATGTSPNQGIFLQVEVLTNATVAGSPAVLEAGGTYNGSITTTEAGSYVLGVINDWDLPETLTPVSGCSELSSYEDSGTNSSTYAVFSTTSPTGTPGSTNVGYTVPGSHDGYAVVALEIIPSGGSIGFRCALGSRQDVQRFGTRRY